MERRVIRILKFHCILVSLVCKSRSIIHGYEEVRMLLPFFYKQKCINNVSPPNLFFCRTSAKGAPLNINKVSTSLMNFGRKLISPAAAPGGADGPVPGSSGGTSSPAVVPTRTLAEAPKHPLQQQQRLMKSESMPVQLNKGKGKYWLI